jgi:ADP-ribose pyrophosphatase YjhB (NUDIX family)
MNKGAELINLAARIRASSQIALAYSQNEFEIERCKELLEISDQMVSIVSGASPDEIASCYLMTKEYVTPKVDVRAVVFNDKGEILLVQERMDGNWSMPGGWADVGFAPSEVAVKETKEEAGLDVRVERLLAIMDKRCHNHPPGSFYIYKIFFLCKILGGTLSHTFDILDQGFFPLDNLPPLSLSRTLEEQIILMDQMRKDPSIPVYFD